MTDYEVYDKFFADEEYELENAPQYEYSYRNGWNNGLKRAAILVRDEIRPQGEWGKHGECPFCSYIRQWDDDKFCGNCGADLRKEIRTNGN